ncbi:DUF6571 domain-containing protein [Actinomyces slackii]|uniref:DUF6571 domain-containing protein n=1 Tax=Actinomyces slackii TaxID=52774 RepID=A0A3S4SEA7_9ACTO|nr:DUF6571 family protein [Actinomyces slackii]VEG74074.1 Uncharacterised protein [Actinomyces slackii]
MAYISLDPDGLQKIINDLNGYATKAESSRSAVTMVNSANSSSRGENPVDLFSFSTNMTTYKDDLADEASKLQARLDAAKAANETGMTATAPDGTICYYVPDGVEDTPENVKTHNNVDTWRQANTDAATLVKYSEQGCSPEEWDQLLERMRAGQDDPAYANTIFNNIGPGRILDSITDIDQRFTSVSNVEGTAYSERPNAGVDLANVMGRMLATASNTWPEDKAKAYADRLADMTQEDGKPARIDALNTMLETSQQVDIDGDGVEDSVGLDYNDTFLVTLARRIESHEYDEVPTGDRLRMTSLSIVSNDNPLSGVVHAMTGNRDAGLEWLVPSSEWSDKPITGADSKEHVERVQTLIENGKLSNQDWTRDWARLCDEIDRNVGSSEAPSSDDSSQKRQVSAAATAVSGILNGLGSAEDPPALDSEGRNLVSSVLARHPEGVSESAFPGNPEGPVKVFNDSAGGISYHHPVMTDRALTNLVGQVLQDKNASAHLGESMSDYHEQQLQAAAEIYQDTKDSTELTAAVERQAATNGFFAGAESHQLVHRGVQVDNYATTSNTIVSYGAGLIPVVGDAAALVVDTANPISVNNASEARTEAAKIKSDAMAASTEQITASLLNSGVYSVADIQAMRTSTGTAKTVDESVDNVVDEAGNVLTQGMSPDQLNDPNVRDGLHTLGGHLHNPADSNTSYTLAMNNIFDKAYATASPDAPEAPAHSWGAKPKSTQDDETKDG